MGKGELTRERIVEAATALASRVGLEGLSIGALATELNLSKSGLFGHFGSKEELQLQVLEATVARFEREVFHSAIKQPRGEARVRALFENWLRWNNHSDQRTGCVIVTATVEFDDRPGALRDQVAQEQRRLLEGIRRAAQIAVDAGHFRKDLDLHQFAFAMYGIILSHHFIGRLQSNKKSEALARAAFETLLKDAKNPS